MEHACGTTTEQCTYVRGTTTEQCAYYNMQLHIRSACRPVNRFNMSSSCYLRKRIATDDVQKELLTQNLRSASPTSRIPRRILQNERNFMQRCCQAYQKTFGHNFEHLL
ncbi:hypothetical protein TNCV_3737001 [Trichonephila clavipes]|nr:hypothetical protein TNCV_3737001 [Trichonephila clavipes]